MNLFLISADRPNGGWAFGNGPEFPGAIGELVLDGDVEPPRRPALKLRGDFSAGGKYVQAGIPLPETPIEAISFSIKDMGAATRSGRLRCCNQQQNGFLFT